jgi:cytochrome c oxidase subunit 3
MQQLTAVYLHLTDNPVQYELPTTPTLQRHPFHLIEPSPWPILGSFSALIVALGLTFTMHNEDWGFLILNLGVLCVCIVMWNWWSDVITEAVWKGHHTKKVQVGLRMGVLLFIVSEAMFFFGFFWAFLAASLEPKIQVGAIWPPVGLVPLYWKAVPLLNTVILLYSALTVTITHYAVSLNRRDVAFISLVETLCAAFFFTFLQVMEYMEASFSMSDSVFGSSFFFINRISWIPCYCWVYFFNSLFMKNLCWYIYTYTTYRIRSSNLVLTFCWCNLNCSI